MTEAPKGSEKDQIQAQIKLQDEFKKAFNSQDTLEDVPADALPEEYRTNIRIKQDRTSFYVAFSDNPQDLEPGEGGYITNAHIKKLPAMTGPRRFGTAVKEWIDATREEESKQK